MCRLAARRFEGRSDDQQLIYSHFELKIFWNGVFHYKRVGLNLPPFIFLLVLLKVSDQSTGL